MQPRLTRSRTERNIAGVCGGLGEYFSVDPVIVRLIFIVVTVMSGVGLPAYLLLWLVMPRQSPKEARSPNESFEFGPRRQFDAQPAPDVRQPGWPAGAPPPVREAFVAQPRQQYRQRVAQPDAYPQPPAGQPGQPADQPWQPDTPMTGETLKLPTQQRQPSQCQRQRHRPSWATLGYILVGIGALILLDQLPGPSGQVIISVLFIVGGLYLLQRIRRP